MKLTGHLPPPDQCLSTDELTRRAFEDAILWNASLLDAMGTHHEPSRDPVSALLGQLRQHYRR